MRLVSIFFCCNISSSSIFVPNPDKVNTDNNLFQSGYYELVFIKKSQAFS